MSSHSRNYGLDLVRAIAISFVLLGHYIQSFSPIASIGVEIFFVLSGLLIGGILIKIIDKHQTFNFSIALDFLKRRWFRTVPNYLLFLLINYLYFYFFIGKQHLPENILKYFFFLQNFAWQRDLFFGESWSLCVEEWFYLLVPFATLLYFKVKKNHKDAVQSFFIIILLFLVAPFLLRLFIKPDQYESNMIVIFRLDSIMYGVLLAYLHKRKILLWEKMRGCYIPAHLLFIILSSFIFLDYKAVIDCPDFISQFLPVLVMFMIPFYVSLPQAKSPFIRKAVSNTSLWSYSLYLSHLPIILILKRVVEQDSASTFQKTFFRFLCLILAFLISKIIYEHFEVPLTSLRDRNKRITKK